MSSSFIDSFTMGTSTNAFPSHTPPFRDSQTSPITDRAFGHELTNLRDLGPLRVGARVAAEYNDPEKSYPGRIVGVNPVRRGREQSYRVEYEDGDKHNDIPRSAMTQIPEDLPNDTVFPGVAESRQHSDGNLNPGTGRRRIKPRVRLGGRVGNT